MSSYDVHTLVSAANCVTARVFADELDSSCNSFRREIRNEELNDLYSSPNIVRVITSRRMRLAEHVARMGERSGVYGVLVGKPEGKVHFGDPGVDGRIILRWIFRKLDVGVWTGSSWLRIGTVGGHLRVRKCGFHKMPGIS